VNSAPLRKDYQCRICNCFNRFTRRLAFVCYQTRKCVLYLLCAISTIVPINFLVKSGESTLLLPRADKTRDNTIPYVLLLFICDVVW
jgi:hypothetical protein